MQTQGTSVWRKRSLRAGATIFAAVVLPGLLSGQTVSKMMGIKAGAITTGVSSNVEAFLNTDWRTGISAGGFVSIDPTSALTLRADVLFSQRGFGFRMYQDGAGLIPGEVKVRSLEFQMDVGLRVPWPHQSASVRLFAGPALGFQLSCKVNASMLGMNFTEECDDPVVGMQTHTIDLGLSFGGGIDLHLLPATVVLDGRFTRGLRNLKKNSQSSDSLTSRAWVFTVGLGWPF